MRSRGRPPAPEPLRRYVSFRTLQPRGPWGAVRKALQDLIESTSPASVQAEASIAIGLDADALRAAAEYLQVQYRKLHESEAYLSPGEWERRSRLVTIKVTDGEFEALSRLAEITGLTKSQLMRLALAGKVPELGRGAVKASVRSEDGRFVQGELFSDDDQR